MYGVYSHRKVMHRPTCIFWANVNTCLAFAAGVGMAKNMGVTTHQVATGGKVISTRPCIFSTENP